MNDVAVMKDNQFIGLYNRFIRSSKEGTPRPVTDVLHNIKCMHPSLQRKMLPGAIEKYRKKTGKYPDSSLTKPLPVLMARDKDEDDDKDKKSKS